MISLYEPLERYVGVFVAGRSPSHAHSCASGSRTKNSHQAWLVKLETQLVALLVVIGSPNEAYSSFQGAALNPGTRDLLQQSPKSPEPLSPPPPPPNKKNGGDAKEGPARHPIRRAETANRSV